MIVCICMLASWELTYMHDVHACSWERINRSFTLSVGPCISLDHHTLHFHPHSLSTHTLYFRPCIRLTMSAAADEYFKQHCWWPLPQPSSLLQFFKRLVLKSSNPKRLSAVPECKLQFDRQEQQNSRLHLIHTVCSFAFFWGAIIIHKLPRQSSACHCCL